MPLPPSLLLASLYAVTLAWDVLLHILNLRFLNRHGTEVPDGFEGALDEALLAKTAAYTVAHGRLDLAESLVQSCLVVALLFGGLLARYDRWVAHLSLPSVPAGVLFLLGLVLAGTVLAVPFDLYGTFRLEARYGFTTTTKRLWLADLVRSSLLSLTLVGLLAAGALYLVRLAPGSWWFWVWCLFALVTLFLLFLSPYLIEPLFNRYEPVKDAELVKELHAVMGRAGLRVDRVQQMDASRRSRHTNAYFTGIGRVKRIVLYDTLLSRLGREEIVAVLAHEVGHWKKGHVLRRLLVLEAGALTACWCAFSLAHWDGLPGLIGAGSLSFPARLLVVAFVGSIATFPLTPLSSWLSRRQERDADRYAAGLTGRPLDLAKALTALCRDNLSNLHPHPLYAAFYYSHPPVTERVRVLRGMAAGEQLAARPSGGTGVEPGEGGR